MVTQLPNIIYTHARRTIPKLKLKRATEQNTTEHLSWNGSYVVICFARLNVTFGNVYLMYTHTVLDSVKDTE